ncbi:flippase [Pseudomonas gingeri]|uniref:flippase n=1 Tax=Pseudomonas gingeri TaxID=117681 RepID=UPI0015C036A5|nr:flippase [Pseudomonas gingeri]
MRLLRDLVRESFIYGAGDFLLKLVAFFTFPLLAASLSTSGFGLLELAMTVVSLGAVLVRCGLNNSVQRFYWDQATEIGERPSVVSTGFFLTVALGVAGGIFAFFAVPFIFRLSGNNAVALSLIGVLSIAMLLALTQWAQYLLDVLRLHFSPWKFLGFSFCIRALGALLSVVAVLYWGGGVEGVLLSQALVLLASVPFGLWLIRRDLILRVDPVWSRRLIAFGTPFIFTELAYWLFASIDRWMLASLSGVDDVGVYSVAFRFSTLVVFVATAFGMAWSPYAVKIRSDFPEKHRKIYFEVLLILLVVMLVVAGTIAIFSGELLGVFLPGDYFASAIPLAILCFTAVLQASQQVTAIGISLANRTKVFAYLVWGAAILNVLLNWWLIPKFGVSGAAWSTVLAYFFLSAGFLFYTQRYYPLPISWFRLLWICALGSIVLLVGVFFQQSNLDFGIVAIKLAIAVSCLLLSLPALDFKVFREL